VPLRLRKPDGGTVHVKGVDVTGKGPAALHAAGLSYIPEDRHSRGLVLDFTLTENVLLGNLDGPPFTKRGQIDYGASEDVTSELMARYDVRAPSPGTHVRALSGGNQQKLIIARELHRQPDVILAVQPTRGSTWARSSSFTGSWWRSGTMGGRSCWSRSSWTSCWT
jgi:simple sugar transport system ATP-binding protein